MHRHFVPTGVVRQTEDGGLEREVMEVCTLHPLVESKPVHWMCMAMGVCYHEQKMLEEHSWLEEWEDYLFEDID